MIDITSAAQEEIKKAIGNKKNAKLRIGVKTSGCSGLAYVLEIAYQVEVDDIEIKIDASNSVLINKKSEIYLKETQLDFKYTDTEEGFVFNNPNVESECGCGKSFTV